MPKTIRIATRKSQLAMWQAEHVANRLRELHPGLRVALLPRSTFADQHLDTPLTQLGGKALFLKELEQALMDGDADIAVHSMKDVPAQLPQGLCISAILKREVADDAFVSNAANGLAALPAGATVGTSSLRRRAQLLARRDDIQVTDLRGNVNTRLKKLDAGEFDAIILACAGLIRLNMPHRITQRLGPPDWFCAVGQGAVGVEQRENDARVAELLAPLAHTATRHCVLAERAFNARLEGNCQVPVAAYAQCDSTMLEIAGWIGSTDGRRIFRDHASMPLADANRGAAALAQKLLDAGADRVLEELRTG